MATEHLIPLGEVTPRGEEKSKKRSRKKEKNGKENDTGVQSNQCSSSQQPANDMELAPLQLSRSGRIQGVVSPGKATTKKTMIAVPKPPPGSQTKLLDSLPKVERRGFDVEAKLFQQVQKEYEEARTKKKFIDLGDKQKHKAVTPLLARSLPRQEAAPAALGTTAGANGLGLLKTGSANDSKLGMKMNAKSVLPSIPTAVHPAEGQEGCSSQRGESEKPTIRTVEEVQSMLPREYSELKQMMELHRDLKGQMARNKEQMARLQDADGEMMDLLRQQSSHVVMMMKDILDRMEEYPEELWALYGAVEAYEQCMDNRERLMSRGEDALDAAPEENNLGPTTVQEHEEALADIYSHILEAVENFLSLEKEDASGNCNMGG